MCKYLFVIAFIIFLTVSSKAQNFNKIIQNSGISKEELGVSIVKSGEVVFEHNAQKNMTPASLSKILTAIATYKTFKPDERFVTELQSNAEIADGYLSGPLYLKGNGDPSFISEGMWVLVNNFKRNGIKKIKGPIYVDDLLFDDSYFDKSRQSVRVDRAYDAPVSAASFNWNSVNVYIRPTKNGSYAEIFLDPENSYFKIINKVNTVSGAQSDIQINLKSNENGQGEIITVTGTIGVKSNEVVKYASIQTPYIWIGKNLIQFLNEKGISVEDQNVLRVKEAIRYKKLAESKGWTVHELVDGMMKYSNNFIAEMLTKKISVKNGDKVGTIEKGVVYIQRSLEEYGLKSKDYSFENPSGFSNKNKISSRDMALLLSKVNSDFSISSYFVSSFAVPGGEGTLSRRLNQIKFPYTVRGKTGLLSGAIGLAGYFSNKKGEVFSYSMIYNGNNEGRAKELFERLVLEASEGLD